MKKIWTAGTILATALALAACGGGNKSGNTTAANTSAGNATAPVGNTSGGGNSATGNESTAAGGGERATGGSQQDFTLVNSTGHTVMTLNVSPSNSNQWGPDILGRDVLANGEQAQITFARNEDQCSWDIRATYQDGDTTDARGVNLCETTTVTLTAE